MVSRAGRIKKRVWDDILEMTMVSRTVRNEIHARVPVRKGIKPGTGKY